MPDRRVKATQLKDQSHPQLSVEKPGQERCGLVGKVLEGPMFPTIHDVRDWELHNELRHQIWLFRFIDSGATVAFPTSRNTTSAFWFGLIAFDAANPVAGHVSTSSTTLMSIYLQVEHPVSTLGLFALVFFRKGKSCCGNRPLL